MAGQQHKVLAQNAELRCSGLAEVKSVHSKIRQSWVFGLQMPGFFIKTVQSGRKWPAEETGDYHVWIPTLFKSHHGCVYLFFYFAFCAFLSNTCFLVFFTFFLPLVPTSVPPSLISSQGLPVPFPDIRFKSNYSVFSIDVNGARCFRISPLPQMRWIVHKRPNVTYMHGRGFFNLYLEVTSKRLVPYEGVFRKCLR